MSEVRISHDADLENRVKNIVSMENYLDISAGLFSIASEKFNNRDLASTNKEVSAEYEKYMGKYNEILKETVENEIKSNPKSITKWIDVMHDLAKKGDIESFQPIRSAIDASEFKANMASKKKGEKKEYDKNYYELNKKLPKLLTDEMNKKKMILDEENDINKKIAFNAGKLNSTKFIKDHGIDEITVPTASSISNAIDKMKTQIQRMATQIESDTETLAKETNQLIKDDLQSKIKELSAMKEGNIQSLPNVIKSYQVMQKPRLEKEVSNIDNNVKIFQALLVNLIQNPPESAEQANKMLETVDTRNEQLNKELSRLESIGSNVMADRLNTIRSTMEMPMVTLKDGQFISTGKTKFETAKAVVSDIANKEMKSVLPESPTLTTNITSTTSDKHYNSGSTANLLKMQNNINSDSNSNNISPKYSDDTSYKSKPVVPRANFMNRPSLAASRVSNQKQNTEPETNVTNTSTISIKIGGK